MTKPIALVAAYGVRYPLGGALLSQLYYLIGLQQLGYEAIWVEHFGWPNSCYDPDRNAMSDDPACGINILHCALAQHGIQRWCYVDAAGNYHGLTRDELKRVCRESTCLISLAATTWMEEFQECRHRIFIDPDPGFTQFRMPAKPSPSCAGYASPWNFTHHFTLGCGVGQPGCPIPTHGLTWHPTRWPLPLSLITPHYNPTTSRFTTVMSWTAYGSSTYEGVTYGQKDIELLKLLDLPSQTGPLLELALAGCDAPRQKLTEAGWLLRDALEVTRTIEGYRTYIAQSRGEFSVAKHGYVATRSGWFSERTLTYLASGKPAIVQDTGFRHTLPCGAGLFAFQSREEILTALDAIQSNYKHHCQAARALVEAHFEASKVLRPLLQTAGCA